MDKFIVFVHVLRWFQTAVAKDSLHWHHVFCWWSGWERAPITLRQWLVFCVFVFVCVCVFTGHDVPTSKPDACYVYIIFWQFFHLCGSKEARETTAYLISHVFLSRAWLCCGFHIQLSIIFTLSGAANIKVMLILAYLCWTVPVSIYAYLLIGN